MKKVNLNTVAKRFFLGNIVAAALFLSTQASASTYTIGEGGSDTAKASKLEVKYVGNMSNNINFDVCYSNMKGSKFSFVVKDGNDEVIFEKTYNNKQFHKTVEMARTEDIKSLSFNIYSDQGNLLQSKDVVINTKLVEEVLVKIN